MKRMLVRTAPAAMAAGLVLTFTSASAVTSSTYEADVITNTNTQRVAHDRVAVKAQSCADRWAEGQAAWMAHRKVLKHRDGRLSRIMRDCHFRSASENIAYGYSSGSSVVAAWMNSSGHRTNILRSKSRYIGVGAVQDSRGVWWVAQVFGNK